MEQELADRLKAIDFSLLTDVVRQDLSSQQFQITNWAYRRLSDKGVINPEGLWLFSGEGRDEKGQQSWSVVVKVFPRPEQETSPDHMWYWKREILVAQAGLTGRLPGPVKAPRFYRVDEYPTDSWLWMEHVQATRPKPWKLEDYVFAARQLGQWNGACAAAMPALDEPWLSQQLYRHWLAGVNPEQDLQNPLSQKYFSGSLRERYMRLWDERERFFAVLENLPQYFSHFDSQARNLFIRSAKNDGEELVIVDWAMCGFGPLGSELYALVSMSAFLLEWPPEAANELDAAVFPAYLQGLKDAGWSGDADLVRLGFTAWLAVWMGIIYPFALNWWGSEEAAPFTLQQFGAAGENIIVKWLPLCSYVFDLADEARSLM